MVNFGKSESWLMSRVLVIRIFDKSGRPKTSRNSVKIVVSLQSFGRFLSLRPEVVPISPKFRNYWVLRENLFISEIDQSLGFIWHFPQKSSPKRTIIYVIFCAKIKKLYNTFRSYFLFALVPDLLLLQKNFLHSKIFSVWRICFGFCTASKIDNWVNKYM